MTKPLVSVLIDTYNQEHFLEQAIESVLAQGLSPSELEILVVDDGSTDNTAALAAKFAPRVRYMCKKNGGQASAFNAGIPELHGEFIAFLDADDWWAKNKLSAVLGVFKNDPSIGTVGHAYYRCYDESKPGDDLTEIVAPAKSTRVTLSSSEGARHADPLRVFFATSRLAVRKTILDRVPPIPDELIFSADAFILTLMLALADAHVLAEPLCFYRQHAENLYSFRSADLAKERRRYVIIKKLVEVLPVALAAAGVSPEAARALLGNDILEAKQLQLRREGGWPWETFRTEFLLFRRGYRKYSLGYGAYKWLVLASTLAVPPRVFYTLREWYVEHNLRRFRNLLGEPVPVSSVRPRAISSAADHPASESATKDSLGKNG
jgi:glycosyltransferase involved in cell wall biosynthesis